MLATHWNVSRSSMLYGNIGASMTALFTVPDSAMILTECDPSKEYPMVNSVPERAWTLEILASDSHT